MTDANFDTEFAKFKAGVEALASVAAQNPELAAQFAAALDSASSDAQSAADLAQAQAQTNAIRALNDQVMQTLAAATTPEEPEPVEPEE